MDTNNIIDTIKKMTDNLSALRQEVVELPELKSARAIINPSLSPLEKLSPEKEEKRRLLSKGLKALNKIEKGFDEQITVDEERGLEAIILQVVRPAILVQNGRFSEPPHQWRLLNDHRQKIEQSLRCVGRIEVKGHPHFEWLGTGFAVGKGIIMTNRHVAVEFAKQDHGDWAFIPGRSSSINFIEELGAKASLEFEVEEVIGIHKTFDLALLRIKEESNNGENVFDPLEVIAAKPPAVEKRQVYVVGYPAWDGTRNEPEQMQKIFADIYNVKRLQPGLIQAFDSSRHELLHDCSTLGGNSGSPVFDLESGRVLGLHFGGRYLQNNHAVALWTIADELLLRNHVNFQ